MLYSDVINNGWHKILPKKDKYTKKDMNRVWVASLMDPSLNNGKTFDAKTARWIVICTAAFYDANVSRYIDQYFKIDRKRIVKSMVG